MLWEKPEEKETKAMGYTAQERYRSRWPSPISRYSHLCAGDSQESRTVPGPCPPPDQETQAWGGEAQAIQGVADPKRRQEQDPGSLPSFATS